MDGRIHLNADKLKSLRHERFITQEILVQECLAANIHISIATIKRAETGKSVLYRTAFALSKYYQLPIEVLTAEEAEF